MSRVKNLKIFVIQNSKIKRPQFNIAKARIEGTAAQEVGRAPAPHKVRTQEVGTGQGILKVIRGGQRVAVVKVRYIEVCSRSAAYKLGGK